VPCRYDDTQSRLDQRCTNPSGDDCRHFPCQNKECHGVHFASCLDSDTLLDCTECGLSMSAADATTMLCYESIGFPNQIAEIDSDDMHRTGHLHITQNISRRIRSRPPHPFHYKALEVCTWTWQQDLSRF
jgi:hypothetical protein